MLIRRELPSDADAIRAVHLAAFAKPATDDAPAQEGTLEANLVDDLRADGDLVEECCLVAEVDGVVAGHVAISRAFLDDEPVLVALGPLGVLPEVQRSGIGSALVHAALAAADAMGEPAMVLLGHPTYYPRFGFGPAVDHGVHPAAGLGSAVLHAAPAARLGRGPARCVPVRPRLRTPRRLTRTRPRNPLSRRSGRRRARGAGRGGRCAVRSPR